jgi:hypothetical protein
MAYLRSKVVKQAQSWLGCKESDGSHAKIIDVYNAYKPLARGYKVSYTDSWCATFVSAVAIKLGYTEIIPTECSCNKMIDLFKKIGSWIEDDSYVPRPGDIVFYDWNDKGTGDNIGTVEHVGIVEKVEGIQITIIEGNHDGDDADAIDGVERRYIQVNGKFIRGYGVPKYDKESTPKSPIKKKIDEDGIWGVETTKKAQEIFGTVVDGKVSNQCKKYAATNPGLLSSTFDWKTLPIGSSSLIKAIQKKVGATKDGRIGPNTIKAMQRWLGTPVDGVVDKPSVMVKAFQKWLNKQ